MIDPVGAALACALLLLGLCVGGVVVIGVLYVVDWLVGRYRAARDA